MRKITKEKLKKALKQLIVKGYLYSYRELARMGLEYREVNRYLLPFLKKKVAVNPDGNDRNYFISNEKLEKILNTTIKEVLVYEPEEVIRFIKLLYCIK